MPQSLDRTAAGQARSANPAFHGGVHTGIPWAISSVQEDNSPGSPMTRRLTFDSPSPNSAVHTQSFVFKQACQVPLPEVGASLSSANTHAPKRERSISIPAKTSATWAVRALIRTGMAAAFWLCYICLLLIIGYWLCLQLAHPPSTPSESPWAPTSQRSQRGMPAEANAVPAIPASGTHAAFAHASNTPFLAGARLELGLRVQDSKSPPLLPPQALPGAQEPVKTQLWLNKFQDVSWPTSGNMTMRPRLPFTFEAAHQESALVVLSTSDPARLPLFSAPATSKTEEVPCSATTEAPATVPNAGSATKSPQEPQLPPPLLDTLQGADMHPMARRPPSFTSALPPSIEARGCLATLRSLAVKLFLPVEQDLQWHATVAAIPAAPPVVSREATRELGTPPAAPAEVAAPTQERQQPLPSLEALQVKVHAQAAEVAALKQLHMQDLKAHQRLWEDRDALRGKLATSTKAHTALLHRVDGLEAGAAAQAAQTAVPQQQISVLEAKPPLVPSPGPKVHSEGAMQLEPRPAPLLQANQQQLGLLSNKVHSQVQPAATPNRAAELEMAVQPLQCSSAPQSDAAVAASEAGQPSAALALTPAATPSAQKEDALAGSGHPSTMLPGPTAADGPSTQGRIAEAAKRDWLAIAIIAVSLTTLVTFLCMYLAKEGLCLIR
eukprot:jgi/Astpho2/3319/fgenesh1_pg.00054_%23_19_t